MGDAPAPAGHSPDQALPLEPVGKGAERLISLEGLVRQLVRRGTRVSVDGTQRIPLRQRRADLAQASVERPLMAVLGLLDGTAEDLDAGGHAPNGNR